MVGGGGHWWVRRWKRMSIDRALAATWVGSSAHTPFDSCKDDAGCRRQPRSPAWPLADEQARRSLANFVTAPELQCTTPSCSHHPLVLRVVGGVDLRVAREGGREGFP